MKCCCSCAGCPPLRCATRFFVDLTVEVDTFMSGRMGGLMMDSLLFTGVGVGRGGRSASEVARVFLGGGKGSALLGGMARS